MGKKYQIKGSYEPTSKCETLRPSPLQKFCFTDPPPPASNSPLFTPTPKVATTYRRLSVHRLLNVLILRPPLPKSNFPPSTLSPPFPLVKQVTTSHRGLHFYRPPSPRCFGSNDPPPPPRHTSCVSPLPPTPFRWVRRMIITYRGPNIYRPIR